MFLRKEWLAALTVACVTGSVAQAKMQEMSVYCKSLDKDACAILDLQIKESMGLLKYCKHGKLNFLAVQSVNEKEATRFVFANAEGEEVTLINGAKPEENLISDDASCDLLP